MRHPVYLAEILMSSGVLATDLRLTMLFGEAVVIVLQITRIRAEEALLIRTFPAFEEFEVTTRHRLIPGVW